MGLVGIVGLALSAIGKSQTSRDGTGGGKLATAGIIIGIISVVYGLIQLGTIFS